MQSALLLVATLAGTALAVAVPPENVGLASFDAPKTVYPNGLPEELKPIKDPEGSSLSKRDSAGVYLCTDRNFEGYCVHITPLYNTCNNLGSDLNDLVSSVGPDQGNHCYFYGDYDCKGDQGMFDTTFPGYNDLSSAGSPGPQFNDVLSSFYCERN